MGRVRVDVTQKDINEAEAWAEAKSAELMADPSWWPEHSEYLRTVRAELEVRYRFREADPMTRALHRATGRPWMCGGDILFLPLEERKRLGFTDLDVKIALPREAIEWRRNWGRSYYRSKPLRFHISDMALEGQGPPYHGYNPNNLRGEPRRTMPTVAPEHEGGDADETGSGVS